MTTTADIVEMSLDIGRIRQLLISEGEKIRDLTVERNEAREQNRKLLMEMGALQEVIRIAHDRFGYVIAYGATKPNIHEVANIFTMLSEVIARMC